MSIPSAVLGEYLNDVEAVWAFTEPSAFKRELRELNDPINRGLAPYLGALYGDEIAFGYVGDLIERARAQRRADAKENWQRELERRQAAKVEQADTVKVRPKRKAKRTDATYNERRMRTTLLAVVKPNGWTGYGVRRLAQEASMPHRTARGVLKRMESDGQILIQPWRKGQGYGRHGIRILREHPCWSELNTHTYSNN
jgi:hypothetical protein